MTYNRITAEIGESRRITTRPISYQYDTVQILMLTAADGVELPSYFQVDFCVIGDTDTVTIVGSLTGGAPIPDSLLQQGENLMAYLVLTGSESDVQTRYEITIPVNERPTRSGIEMTSEQQAQVDSLVAALNDGVTRSETAADEAEAASQAVQDMGVEAETLPEGSAATVEKTVDPETGVVTLTYGIPKGAKGDKGDKGNPGETYLLAPSVDTIVKNPNTGTFIPAQIVFTVYKVVNGTSSPYRAAAIVADIFGSGMVPHYEVVNDYRLTVPINSIADTGYVACTAYGNGGIIATITIPCILDGAKGDPGEGVAAGGTTGQFLKKKSGTDYDTEWADVDPGVTSVNGKTGAVTLTASDVGAKPASYEAPVSSVNEKTGAVVLDAGDIGYDGETTYPDASVGKELTTINSALTSLQSVTEIIDTASGAIASFPDGSGLPMRSLVAQINPVQDLHGQSSPYPAGGGKNIYPYETIPEYTYGWYSDYTFDGTPNKVLIKANTDYILSFQNSSSQYVNVRVFDTSKNLITDASVFVAEQGTDLFLPYNSTTHSFRLSGLVTYNWMKIRSSVDAYINLVMGQNQSASTSVQLELGTTATEWSPYSNICPISGWTGLSGQRTGKNLLPYTEQGAYKTVDGTPILSNSYVRSPKIIAKPNVTYWVRASVASVAGLFWDVNGNFISGNDQSGVANRHWAAPSNAHYVAFNFYSNAGNITPETVGNIMVNVGSGFADYEPYTGEPISASFGQTVYGGTDEVISGSGTSTMAIYDGGDLTWTKVTGNNYRNFYGTPPQRIAYSASQSTIISSNYKSTNNNASSASEDCYVWALAVAPNNAIAVKDTAKANMTAEEFKAAMTGVQFLCVLDTPQTFTHEGQSVDTLVGQNNVFVDTGDVEVTYQASIKGYIDKVLAS